MTAGRIKLGRIGAAHGVKGAVRIRTYTSHPMAIADYGGLTDRHGRVLKISECRPAKDGVIAAFAGISDRDAAETLKGIDLFVDRTALPEPDEDEYYHSDLLGLAVTDKGGQTVGTVKAVLDHGAGQFLEIAPSRGRTLLIPFTNAAVPVIDIKAGRIIIDPPLETDVPNNVQEGKDTP